LYALGLQTQGTAGTCSTCNQNWSDSSADLRWPPARTSLVLCPSFIYQALRAANVASRLPLRIKVRALTTTFHKPTHPKNMFFVRANACAHRTVQGKRITWHIWISPCSMHRQNCRRLPPRSAGCLPSTSNPAGGHARAAPHPVTFQTRRFAPSDFHWPS